MNPTELQLRRRLDLLSKAVLDYVGRPYARREKPTLETLRRDALRSSAEKARELLNHGDTENTEATEKTKEESDA